MLEYITLENYIIENDNTFAHPKPEVYCTKRLKITCGGNIFIVCQCSFLNRYYWELWEFTNSTSVTFVPYDNFETATDDSKFALFISNYIDKKNTTIDVIFTRK
jgi:hypothetical protein